MLGLQVEETVKSKEVAHLYLIKGSEAEEKKVLRVFQETKKLKEVGYE
jgi:hypothetical protein